MFTFSIASYKCERGVMKKVSYSTAKVMESMHTSFVKLALQASSSMRTFYVNIYHGIIIIFIDSYSFCRGVHIYMGNNHKYFTSLLIRTLFINLFVIWHNTR